MDFKSFLSWKKQPTPQQIINENLEELAEMGKFPAFKLYLDIIEWRVHNLGERSGVRPKEAAENAQMIKAFRMVLQDFKKINEKFKQRNNDGSK